MVEWKINDDNILVLLGLAIFLISSIIIFSVYPPARVVTGLYTVFFAVGFTIYSNPAIQDYLFGIPKSLQQFVIALSAAPIIVIGFLVLPKVIPGMSMGIPLLPAAIGGTFMWIFICGFAPFGEDVLRFGILGLTYWLLVKIGVKPKTALWIAIFVQAIVFTAIHATAYAAGWYQAPTWLGALQIVSAVQASLIAAFLFALVTGYVVTRDGIKNVLVSILAHYGINQVLFVKVGKLVVFYGLPVLIKFVLSLV